MVTGSLAVEHGLTEVSICGFRSFQYSVTIHMGGISTVSSAFLNNREGELKRPN